MASIIEDHGRLEQERDALRAAVMDAFAGKVREEILEAEALLPTDAAEARVKAAEALAYYYPLAEDLEGRLGEEKRIVMETWLRQLQTYAEDGYLKGVQVARSSILAVLDEYQGLQGLPEIRQIIQALSFTLEEYSEGVSEDGTVTDEGELQEARAFMALAQDLWAQARSRVEAVDPGRVAKVDTGLQQASDLVNSLAPPSELEPVIQGLVATLRELANVSESASLTPSEHLARLRENLTLALAAYQEGRWEEADRIVATAYLEHFEPIEPELERVNPGMMEELERAIRLELRGLIQEGADSAVVEAKVTDIIQRTLQAEEALSQPPVVRELDTSLLVVLVAALLAELLIILYLLARLRVFQERMGEGGS
jgi:hypothetical protein